MGHVTERREMQTRNDEKKLPYAQSRMMSLVELGQVAELLL